MRIAILCFIALFSSSSFAKTVLRETPPLEFAGEYIQIQSDSKSSTDLASKELDEAGQLAPTEKMNSIMSGVIRNGTRVKIKLQFHIRMLQGMRLNKQFDFGREALIQQLQQKLALWNEMIFISKSFIEAGSTPNPKINYSKMSSRMPEISAELDSCEENIFNISRIVLLMFVHSKPDSQNHMSHLNITREEANSLANTIRVSFGESLNQEKDIKYPIAAAKVVLEQITTRGYKYADDPWE